MNFNGPYNLRGSTGSTNSLNQSHFPNPIEKRLKATFPERSTLCKAREVLEEDNVFFELVSLEKQIDSKILRRQTQVADSTFRSNKVKRNLKIYASSNWIENEIKENRRNSNINGASVENEDGDIKTKSLSLDEAALMEVEGEKIDSWIVRIEGRLDNFVAGKANRNMPIAPIKKFTSLIKSIVVEIDNAGDEEDGPKEVIEWVKSSSSVESDGFEIKRVAKDPSRPISLKIIIQMDFAPEKYRLSPELASLLNLTLATKPTVILALWQYIKIHKLQESDEKKSINNDPALQSLFKVSKMTFSEIPEYLDPHMLPPEPIIIDYSIKPVSQDSPPECPFAYEVEVEVEDPAKTPRYLLPAANLRDLAFQENRIREILEALKSSIQTRKILLAFAEDPVKTSNDIMKLATRDFETVVGDLAVTLDKVNQSDLYGSESVEQAINDFLSINARFIHF